MKVCNPPILGIPNSFLIPVWTLGILIHHPPPPLQILLSGWHQAKIDFLAKNSIFVIFRPQGARFRENPPYFEGARHTGDPNLPPGEVLWPAEGCSRVLFVKFQHYAFFRRAENALFGKIGQNWRPVPPNPLF